MCVSFATLLKSRPGSLPLKDMVSTSNRVTHQSPVTRNTRRSYRALENTCDNCASEQDVLPKSFL